MNNKNKNSEAKREEYAYKTIEDFEKIVDYKVNKALKSGWMMARLKNKHLFENPEKQETTIE